MATLIVKPGNSLNGGVGGNAPYRIRGDKSISHRAALFAAAAEGESQIDHFLNSGVTQVMLDSLEKLGNSYEFQGDRLIVQGLGFRQWKSYPEPLNCGNSATTMRLLAGAIAASGMEAVLVGSDGLNARPMKRIVEPLRQMGVPITSTDEGTAPLRLGARSAGYLNPLKGYFLPVASAQVKTCLLLAGLGAQGETTLYEPGLSRDHTERMLEKMGVPILSSRVEIDGKAFYGTKMDIVQPFHFPPLRMAIPGDFSSAAFLLAAGLITPGAAIEIKDVGLNSTRIGLLEVFQSMGGDIQVDAIRSEGGEPVGNLVVRHSSLRGIEIGGEREVNFPVVRMIDEFPIFAAAACFAQGVSKVFNAEELRNKESDRIASMCHELRRLGADIHETPDGFIINGKGSLNGGMVETHRDHRLAMSLAVAGLAADGEVRIQNAEIVNESFPEFGSIFSGLGANFKWEELP